MDATGLEVDCSNKDHLDQMDYSTTTNIPPSPVGHTDEARKQDNPKKSQDLVALKAKDQNKQQNDFSLQFLNFLNTSNHEDEESVKDVTDDEVGVHNDINQAKEAQDSVVDVADLNKKTVEGKIMSGKKIESPGSSDKENKVEKKSKSTEKSPSSETLKISDPAQKPRRKLNDFIEDKSLRIRSFLRRRQIPLKRIIDLDIQCGTCSFALQASKFFCLLLLIP